MARRKKNPGIKDKKANGRNKTESTQTEFAPDYSDVIKDLRRIGLLAGIFFIVLVGLSFIIN
jgi:hypothetical protein